jgi:hypothetical protein
VPIRILILSLSGQRRWVVRPSRLPILPILMISKPPLIHLTCARLLTTAFIYTTRVTTRGLADWVRYTRYGSKWVLRMHTWPGDLRLNNHSAVVEPLGGLTVSLYERAVAWRAWWPTGQHRRSRGQTDQLVDYRPGDCRLDREGPSRPAGTKVLYKTGLSPIR